MVGDDNGGVFVAHIHDQCSFAMALPHVFATLGPGGWGSLTPESLRGREVRGTVVRVLVRKVLLVRVHVFVIQSSSRDAAQKSFLDRDEFNLGEFIQLFL